MIKNYLIADVESYFNKEEGYDLGSLSLVEYIRDKRFKMHGVGWELEGQKYWTTDVNKLKQAVNWKETALIAHNIKYDAAVLAWHYGIHPALYIDTKGLAKAVLGPNIAGYSLDEAGKYLGLKSKGTILHKFDGIRTLTPEQEEDLADYCLDDVEICSGIYAHLWPQFPESQRKALDWTIRTFVEPKLKLDISILQRMVENERTRREDAIKQSGVDRGVLSSNQQFAALLRQRGLQFTTKRSKRTGKKIPALGLTDPGFLALREQDSVLFEARKAAKSTIIETRGENLINVATTGSWPFDVQFSGAVQTHRYSGGDGAGGNPQNFPRSSDIKRAVVADGEPRGVLVVGDFSAIELRINAWVAKEQWLIEKLTNGDDVYSEFASKVYGRVVVKGDKERQFGKCAELGLGYGMGKDRFKNEAALPPPRGAETIISLEDAKSVVQLYRSTHTQIKNLWTLAEKLLPMIVEGRPNHVFFAPFLSIEKDAIILPSGLKIMYPNLRRLQEPVRIGDKLLRAGSYVFDRYEKRYESSLQPLWGGTVVENICQALAGEICKEAIDRALHWKLNVVGQIHDEIMVVSSAEHAEKTADILRRAMEQTPYWWPNLKLKAEVEIGNSWAEAKK